jgi:nucleotidyltransferase substrate binding protein (TIGR01987 family)
MERLKIRCSDCGKASNTLREILREPFSIIVRDATIQRFEYTFEAFWKCVREYLRVKEGIECNSPKGCFRELFSLGTWITEEEAGTLLIMADDRNMTSHAYKEAVAQAIYNNIDKYSELILKIFAELKKKII